VEPGLVKSLVPGQSRIAIDASSFTQAALAFGDKFDLQAGLEVERAMRDSAGVVQRAVIKRAKRHRRTGRLERQVKIAETGAGWDLIVRVHSGGRVAHLVAGPTRAHTIAVRSVQSPSMPIYRAGSLVGFARSVEHRASRGDPYFHVGAMNSRLAINAILKASGRRLATHLAEMTKGTA
jgi:bacteriophage HK97-gp10 putative tail-component